MTKGEFIMRLNPLSQSVNFKSRYKIDRNSTYPNKEFGLGVFLTENDKSITKSAINNDYIVASCKGRFDKKFENYMNEQNISYEKIHYFEKFTFDTVYK